MEGGRTGSQHAPAVGSSRVMVIRRSREAATITGSSSLSRADTWTAAADRSASEKTGRSEASGDGDGERLPGRR